MSDIAYPFKAEGRRQKAARQEALKAISANQKCTS
uniref:Uncharacterized protein n=1 Tax=Moorena bouillonii PNG TaxID=568701 RepID=A0A0H4TMV1_9CYAN|nr:hypothetical protein [Moorena bouillonii PNG]